jgi:hypothetical protein
MDNNMNTQQRYAHDYWHAGLVPIPLRLDGSKRPAIDAWQRWQSERPSEQQLTEWFAKPAGIGIVCGIVSGGVEVIDFDESTLFEPIYESLPADLRDQLSVYEALKSVWHGLDLWLAPPGNANPPLLNFWVFNSGFESLATYRIDHSTSHGST